MVPVISYFVLTSCLYCFGLTIIVEKSFYQRHKIKFDFKKRFPRNQRPMLIKIKKIKKQPQPIKDRILKEKKNPYLILTTHSSFSRLLELRITYSCLTPNQYCFVEGSEEEQRWFVFIAPEWYRPKLFSLLTAPGDPSKSHSFSLLLKLFTNQAPLRSILV